MNQDENRREPLPDPADRPEPQENAPKKTRVPFYRWLLPWKGDAPREVVYKIVFLIAGCVFLVCAGILTNEFVIEPFQNDAEQQDIRSVYYAASQAVSSASPESKPASASSAVPERDAQGRLIRFVNLQKINSDIVGWIKIPNTNIDLPVLQANAKQPEFYLDHDYNKKYSKYGSIFADYRAPVAGEKSKSIILYGHSLRSRRMFTQLDKYKDLAFCKQNPVFSFDTENGESQWKIISVFVTNTLPSQGTPFNYMKTSFASDSDYLNFVYQLRIRSMINTGVSFNAKDRILVLSTCSYEFDGFREVVVARKVRSGESAAVDTAAVKRNPKTLYPDCWYSKNGGKKPQWPSTYEQAVKQNLLSWSEK